MKALGRIAVSLFVATTLASGVHAADLLSGSVSVTNNSPTLTDVYAGPTSGSTASGVSLEGFTFTFTSDTVTYTNPYGPDSYTNVGPGGFNGFVLVFTDVPEITSVTNDPSSQLDPSNIYFTGDSISINLNGLARTPGETSVFDVSFSNTPEPATWAMMLLGIAGIGTAMRISRRKPSGSVVAA